MWRVEEVTRYAFRWPFAYAEVAVPALLFAGQVALAFWSGPRSYALIGLAVLLALLVWAPVSIRRRRLTCWPGGLVAQLHEHRLAVDWDDLVRVQQQRFCHVVPVEELVFRQARADPVGSRGRSGRLPPDVGEHPGETRVMVSLFDKQWRRGPIGEYARTAGIDV